MFEWFIWHSFVVAVLSFASFGLGYYTCLFLKGRDRPKYKKIFSKK